jgi:hypothetical protein
MATAPFFAAILLRPGADAQRVVAELERLRERCGVIVTYGRRANAGASVA